MVNDIGGSLSRAVLDDKISNRCVVYALAGLVYKIVYHIFTWTTDDILYIERSNINITLYKT